VDPSGRTPLKGHSAAIIELPAAENKPAAAEKVADASRDRPDSLIVAPLSLRDIRTFPQAMPVDSVTGF
jgi:hypothetical protein